MKNENPELSLAVIEGLKGNGYNQSEIAEMFGKTRQAVSWWKQTYGGRMTPREIIMKEFPFQGIPRNYTQTIPYRCLRHHGEFVATGGVGMAEDKLTRLRSFYRKLRDENLVLEFDPSIPPEKGVSKFGGWANRPRVSQDGDLLIRVNEFTELSDKGKTIWRFPRTEPSA